MILTNIIVAFTLLSVGGFVGFAVCAILVASEDKEGRQ